MLLNGQTNENRSRAAAARARVDRRHSGDAGCGDDAAQGRLAAGRGDSDAQATVQRQ
jgi:hypothetical protein